MTIDETIFYEERNVEINKLIGEVSDCEPTNAIDYHRQLVEWLKELKQLREQEPKTGHWVELTELSCAEYSCYVCSECEAYAKEHSRRLRVQHYKSLFCPDCGLKMEL